MNETRRNPWATVSSAIVYRNQWIQVREDQVIRPDGKPGIYGVIEVPPSIAVLALDAAERLPLIGQWRYPRSKYSWELPVGGAHHDDVDMQAAAVRELREEAGVSAQNWKLLCTLEASIGVTTDTQWVYLATGLSHVPNAPDPEEQLEVQWISFQQALERVLSGEIGEAASVAAILKYDALKRYGLL